MSQPRFILSLLGCLLLGVPGARAGLTLLQRETFQGVGTLTAATPGNLGAPVGAFSKRPVGPRLTTDTSVGGLGWSADTQRQSDMFTQPGAPGTGVLPASGLNDRGVYAIDFWLYVGSPLTDGNSGMQLALVGYSNGASLVDLGTATADGLTLACASYGSVAGPGYTLPLRGWTQIRVAWAQINGYWNYQAAVLVRPAGAAAFTEAFTTMYQITRALDVASAGIHHRNANPANNARVGMLSAYRLDAWADRLLRDPTVADPPAGPFRWYCNPATGSDGNDGTSPATAWASAAKINAESASLGMFPAAAYPVGDTLTIDTAAANLVLGPQGLALATAGLNVVQLGGGLAGAGEIQAWAALAPKGWSAVVGNGLGAINTGIFQQTLSEENAASVLWEDGKWLNHPTGVDFAAVEPTLQSTPGSFWTDGTTLYVHPFGDTDPARDGKAYTRSYNRRDASGDAGAAAVQLLAPDLRLSGLRVRQTCLADPVTSEPLAAYCYQTAGTAGGATLLENCYGDYGGKHIFGFTDNSVTRRYTVRGCQGEQATPYVVFGGQTVWVDFGGGTGSGTATTLYDHCITNRNAGLIGSAAGQVQSAYPAWISHGDGPIYQEIDFVDCALAGPLLSYGGIGTIRVTGGSNGGGSFTGGATFYEGVAVAGPPPTASTAAAAVSVRDCVIVPPTLGGNTQFALGTLDVEGCTVDCRAAAATGPLYARHGALTLTWRSNLLLGPGCPVVAGAVAADALRFDHNAYATNGSAILQGYDAEQGPSNPGLPQMQQLGLEAGSFSTDNPLLNPSDFPLPRSPLIHAGANLGPGPDFTGRLFPRRNAIGAYQPPPSAFTDWQAVYFSAAQGANPAVSGPAAAPAGDGVANLLKYAFGLDPRVPAPASALPSAAFSAGSAALAYRQADYAADLQYTVESSPDLLHWSAANPTLTTLADDGATRQVRAQVPADGSVRRFLRLRVARGN